MYNHIVIVAHNPLASAFMSVAEHIVGKESVQDIVVIDVIPNECAEKCVADIEKRFKFTNYQTLQDSAVLILSDVLGATPCNGAQAFYRIQQLFDSSAVVHGLNLPMLMRAITYRHLPLSNLVEKVVEGGKVGIGESTNRGSSQCK